MKDTGKRMHKCQRHRILLTLYGLNILRNNAHKKLDIMRNIVYHIIKMEYKKEANQITEVKYLENV